MINHQQTTKDKILELLKKEVNLTVSELIEHLQITHMAIRKHLATLEKDQLIISESERVATGRPSARATGSMNTVVLPPKPPPISEAVTRNWLE